MTKCQVLSLVLRHDNKQNREKKNLMEFTFQCGSLAEHGQAKTRKIHSPPYSAKCYGEQHSKEGAWRVWARLVL